jgi:hypothetical protein
LRLHLRLCDSRACLFPWQFHNLARSLYP